jgi:hypothetical protein
MGKTTQIEVAPKTKGDRSIKIQGWDIKDDNLSKLLEETAEFLRKKQNQGATDGEELQFSPVATGDLFIVSHRS